MSHIPDSQLPTADGRQPTAISRANCCVLIISWRLADWSMLCREKSAGLTDYADVCAKVCPKREKVNRTERTPPLAGSMPGPAVTALGRRAAWTRAPIGCFGACWVLRFRCGDSWLFAAAMDIGIIWRRAEYRWRRVYAVSARSRSFCSAGQQTNKKDARCAGDW